MHVWIFSHLSIESVDDKQHLSEVVFSALVGFLLHTTSTHHRVKQSPKRTTGMSSIAYVDARDRNCGQQAIGTSITTMLQHIPYTWFWLFWQKNTFLCFTRLLILLIWLPVTSGCSPNSRGYWKRFQTKEEIMTAITAELNTILKEAFLECFLQWRHCWEMFVDSYFEGD